MGLRDTIQNNAGVGIAIVVICLLGAAYMMFGSGGSPTSTDWYYDLQTGEILAHDPGFDHPPLTLPNGNQGVVVKRFACGACTEDKMFNGYLHKVSQEWIDSRSANPDEQGPIAPIGGQLIAAIPTDGSEPKWVEEGTPMAGQIMDKVRNHCSSGRPTACLPQ